MTSRGQHYGFQSSIMVQPANGGHAYLFGTAGSENEQSEEDGDSYELRPRGRTRRSTSKERMDDIVYLSRDIQEGDTLNSIALQYHCSVADLKRSNNLLTEQDLFALRSVKIPVKRFSMLTETHNTGPLRQASPAEARRPTQISACSAFPIESSTDSSSSTDSVEGFLMEKDKDIEQLVKSTGPSRSSLNEVVSSLTLQLKQPSLGKVEYKLVGKKDPYYGADWGMRWWTAVVIMLVVGIITPVFYLLYYEVLMKAEVSHHGTPTDVPGYMLHAHDHGHAHLEKSHARAGPTHHAAGDVPHEAPQGLKVDSAQHGKT
ncbi:lysM and putative peptidoglycan-binding domain-containing protein 3 [Hippocampus comes]|uniref:LysM and putative peptidoglycan-binding domain-containing protein 3 n=1 Tax=Hippocampus comes TaxID=109280 RepID=A0A3Q2Z677_HIPCM|nr:PREDICTED: lysM and putative peptidoglycan-binding domain-containing protein 3 [Hippocampus comes]